MYVPRLHHIHVEKSFRLQMPQLQATDLNKNCGIMAKISTFKIIKGISLENAVDICGYWLQKI